ncbi:MAG: pantoate--beta-alanine ligase [Armatimonadota bacterium]
MSSIPDVTTRVEDVRARVARARVGGAIIGLVPTMGALHEGHLSLMWRARSECGYVVVSIFVNPTQFGPGEDFQKYPRDLGADVQRVGEVGVDLAFAPEVETMYPPGDSTFVEVTGTPPPGRCAPHRPGHFRGVTTVCARLFNIAGADRAYFGEKDYQQIQIVKRMARDLKFPLEIVPVPTVREADGLAMSSRNAYLSAEERKAAAVLYRALSQARERFAKGERVAAVLVGAAQGVIESQPIVQVQYIELRDAETLAQVDRIERPAVLAVAAFVGKTRLIDNVVLT